MNISGADIPSELVNRATRPQQPAGTSLPVQKVRYSPASGGSVQHKASSESIIDAEYVDLYQPLQRPPEQTHHWRNLIVEADKDLVSKTPQSLKAPPHQQQMIERYGDQTIDTPLPGSYLNLIA